MKRVEFYTADGIKYSAQFADGELVETVDEGDRDYIVTACNEYPVAVEEITRLRNELEQAEADKWHWAGRAELAEMRLARLREMHPEIFTP